LGLERVAEVVEGGKCGVHSVEHSKSIKAGVP